MAAHKQYRGIHLAHSCLHAIFPVLLLIGSLFTLFLFPVSSSQQQQDYTFSVSVDRVLLDVTVFGRNHELLRGLPKESFHVYEDGQLQQISSFESGDVPVAVGVIIDNSRSMRHKRAEVESAALAFIESSNNGDEVFIVNFDDDVQLALPAARPFSSDLTELKGAISSSSPDGRTALYDAIVRAMEHLQLAHLERRELLIISDGGDNASRNTFHQVLTQVQRSNVGVYSIALADPNALEQNIPVLRRLSRESGGEFFLQPGLQNIHEVCQRIAADIRTQYTLSYSPINKVHDGAYRKIKVVVDPPNKEKVAAVARPGYLAPSGPRRPRH